MHGDNKLQSVKQALLTMMRHPWEQGTAANAFIESGDTHIALLMAHEAVARQHRDGRLASAGNDFNITDPCACGESVLFSYQHTGDSRYREAAERMLHYIDHAAGSKQGVQYHNTREPMIAADCMYMVPPFCAAMGQHEQAVHQAKLRFALLWNEKKQVMNHQWDDQNDRLWRDKRWGAASGWTIAALPKVMHALPQSMSVQRQELGGLLEKLVQGMLRYQRADGLFHDLLDEPESFVETNAAQMTAYGLYRSVLWGFLSPRYIPYADAMREAANTKVDALGFVRGVAAAPSFSSSGVSPEGQAFYILMEAAAVDYAAERLPVPQCAEQLP